MKLSEEQVIQLKAFFEYSEFATCGAVITDLDGTAVHEYDGRTVIHASVETGLKLVNDLGRPIVINTLRFPLSVIRTFGKEWYEMSKAPIPVILLNGSQLGYIKQNEEDKAFYFDQLASTNLTNDDIEQVVVQVTSMVRDGLTNVVLFFYPEDWTNGEIIWTPVESAVAGLKNKYLSASSVISGRVEDLGTILRAQPICMIFLLLDVPQEKLMAYQHSRKSNFVTASGIDKLSGTKQMQELLGFDLEHSIGAGDTPMDIFLDGVGLSVHVGNPHLPFKGRQQTILLPGFHEFGDLLFQFANMQMEFNKA